MRRTFAALLMMGGCVFGAETDTVNVRGSAIRLVGASAMTANGMQPLVDPYFMPDFETAHSELSFRGEGWSGTIVFEDLLNLAIEGGPESIVIERDNGRAEMQPIQIRSELSGQNRAWQHTTMSFVTYVDNRAVEVELEMEVQAYDPC